MGMADVLEGGEKEAFFLAETWETLGDRSIFAINCEKCAVTYSFFGGGREEVLVGPKAPTLGVRDMQQRRNDHEAVVGEKNRVKIPLKAQVSSLSRNISPTRVSHFKKKAM